MNRRAESQPQPGAAAVTDAAEAKLLLKHLMDVMDGLLGAIEQETEFVRSGNVAAAAALEATKSELSRLYLADVARVKASHGFLTRAMPDVLAALRQRHDLFRALLQMNLTVLATAHAVSESIMRGASDELARRATPNAYGASGRAAAPPPSSMQPLAVSRVL
jgi:hypothetical protein